MIVRNLVILVNLVENVQVWSPSEPERDLTRLESKHEIFFFLCVYKYWSQIHHGDNVNSQSRSGAGTLKILNHNKIFDWKIDLIGIYFAIQLNLVCYENMFCFVSISTPGQVVNWPLALVTPETSETGLWRLWHWSIPGIGHNKLTKHRQWRQFMFYKRLRW